LIKFQNKIFNKNGPKVFLKLTNKNWKFQQR
jgi:hypothetical protein